MLHYFIVHCIENYADTPLRLIDYVTFRAGAGLITALAMTVLLGPFTVRFLKNLRATAPTRLEGLVDEEFINREKDKTPSMGGLLIVFSIVISTLLWSRLDNQLLLIFLGALVAFSALGFWDDYRKVAKRDRDGIPGKVKLAGQVLISFLALFFISRTPELKDSFYQLMVPFVKAPVWCMPAVIAFLFGLLVVVGSSNAVNLTDGKDGLAVGCTIFCVLTYGAFAYMSSHRIFADHLDLYYIAGASEIVVFSTIIAGACIGFLWYNCFPASMFMGDTGSLALGGIIGLIAVLVKQEILLILVGGVFVMEIVSVMIQVASFKLTGKRVFRCTPIHHHFEFLGWKETQIVIRFWIIAGLLALLGLATLKLR